MQDDIELPPLPPLHIVPSVEPVDYPVGDGKTCDMPICDSHAFEAAPNVHYCPGHALMWREFVNKGGVEQELKNVVPFARQQQEGGGDG